MVKAILQIWLISSILIALLFINQIVKDRKFKKERLESPKIFIDSFQDRNNKLPTFEEFKSQFISSENVNYRIDNQNSQDYTLEVWRGEWFESYSSKSNSYQNRSSEISHILAGVQFIIGGFIPLLLFYYIKKRHKRKIENDD